MMAGCGELDHSPNMLPGRKGEACAALAVPECAICLQSCVHPVRLPCRHVFCYLCVKGASWLGRRCALCRRDIPEDFLERPTLLSPEELRAAGRGAEHAWYYEGRGGWWQYDERTSRELEEAFARGRKSAEMLIAGFVYVADLEHMVQYRRSEHGRRRRIKRDGAHVPKKGVAGLRLDGGDRDGGDPRDSGERDDAREPAPTDPAPTPGAAALEDALAHLQLGPGQDAGPSPHQPPEPEPEPESQPDGGDEAAQRLAPAAGPTASARARRPDGQCTVTEV